MSAFSGRQRKGALRIRRALKREQADTRNAATLPERRKVARLAAQAAALLFISDNAMQGDE